MDPLVHYEVFIRTSPTSRWALEIATDQPHIALSTAEDLVKSGRVAGAMVTKETFNEKNCTFQSETLFKEAVEGATRKATLGDWDPLCGSPDDLYTDRARERIAGLIESWLARNHVTPFELLHNAGVVEQLEAASTELQHAIQKFAIAEVQIRGGVTHEMIRRVQGLLAGAGSRLRRHAQAGVVKAEPGGFGALAISLAGKPEDEFLLGLSVAAASAGAGSWREKAKILLDLLQAAPVEGPGRDLALSVLDQPLAEMLTSSAALQALVGDCDDLGGALIALARLIIPEAVEQAAETDPQIRRVIPQLSAEAARLAALLTADELKRARAAAAKRVLGDLHGHKRLRPSNAADEIMVLRALAMSLTAAAGALLPEEDLLAALGSRSRTLLSSDFLDAYLGEGRSARHEAESLLWLAQNVIGTANKRRAARLLQGSVFGLKFETETLAAAQGPAAQLASLAALQRAVAASSLPRADANAIEQKLGQLGGKLEAKANLVAALVRSNVSAVQKLTYLLRLAAGETAPLGLASDRARTEAMKLVREDELRAELSRDEGQVAVVRDLIQQAGLAA
ncbi:hypothetical protein [Phenylobacterium sp.]|jgi:hypothetical protein|uniref:hypothetical protein n=1 Tax=Phenylobacterium sp. TaxID=1871053 RepID=UPI002F935F27